MNQQLKIGSRVEGEHKSTYRFIQREVNRTGRVPPFKEVTKSIARDHLKDDKQYYSKLKAAKL